MPRTESPRDRSHYKIMGEDRDAIIRTMREHTLRERMASLRALFSLSQGEAAGLVGASRGTWSSWEAEQGAPYKQTPSARYRAALSHVFNLPQSLFVED